MAVIAKPVGPRLLVKPVESTETIHNGLVIPAEVGAQEARAIVQEVGEGWYRSFGEEGADHSPLHVHPGEVVVYERGRGIEVLLDLQENGIHEKFLVLNMSEVLLLLSEAEAPIHA